MGSLPGRGVFRRRPPGRVIVIGATLVILGALLVIAATELAGTVGSISSDPFGAQATAAAVPSAGGARGVPLVGGGVADMLARGERVNLLLVGYGGAGHDGAYLTDSLMIASLDPTAHAVTLLSIPRDLWVTMPASPWAAEHAGKINEVFAIAADHGDRDAGMRLADRVVERVLGVHPHRTIAIDFRAFRSAVDAIGGIEITVDRAFAAAFPANDDPAIDDSWITVSFRAGPQHMDGETALRFARARYAPLPEGTDFARSARQQKIILAARDKIEASGSAPTLLALLGALRDNVRTDLSIADMRALADFARGYDDASTVRAALTDENVLRAVTVSTASGELYTLQPRPQGWGAVQDYVARFIPTGAPP